MTILRAALALTLAIHLAGGPAAAQPSGRGEDDPESAPALTGLPADEAARMRAPIAEQIAAMQRLDAAAAFAQASPEIQQRFGDADNFLAMVARSYAPLPRVAGYEFRGLVLYDGYPTYRVTLQGRDGGTTTAYYLLRRMDDGSYRIAGCILAKPDPSA